MIERWWQYNNNNFRLYVWYLAISNAFPSQKLLYFDSKLTEFGPIDRKSAWIQVMQWFATAQAENHCLDQQYGSGHETATVLLHGFAINW